MTRYMKRGGKVGLKSSLIHHILKTFRSTYGCGKGAVEEGWIAVVKPGRILFEVAGVSEEAREALRLASHKLPVKLSL